MGLMENRSGKQDGELESRKKAPYLAWAWKMGGLTRSGTAKPKLRGYTLRPVRGQGRLALPILLTTGRIDISTLDYLLKVTTTAHRLLVLLCILVCVITEIVDCFASTSCWASSLDKSASLPFESLMSNASNLITFFTKRLNTNSQMTFSGNLSI